MQPYLSVILPISGDQKYLPLVLIDIDKRLSRANCKSEIIVVVSGSIGETAATVIKMSGTMKNLKILENDEDSGIGSAIRQGMLLGAGKFKLFTSPKNSITISHFEDMIPHFKNGADLVVGRRTLPFHLRATRSLLNFPLKTLVPKGVGDITCDFKAFTNEAAEEIFTPLKSTGPYFHIEILNAVKKNNYAVAEIPVSVSNFLSDL